MRANGSLYVSLVVAILAGYFSYQWWFNPHRAIKRQLGDLAATLSAPAGGSDEMDRLARLARLRNHFSQDVQVSTGRTGPSITSREALMAAVGAWKPPAAGWHVTFVDVQITMESDETARAYMTVEVTGEDPRSGEASFDAREVLVRLAEQSGVWVITRAEPSETLQRP